MVSSNLGNLALEDRDFETAKALYEESLAVYRTRGDAWSLAAVLHNLGEAEFYRGNMDGALSHFRECLEIEMHLGDCSCCAGTLWFLSRIDYSQDRLSRAALLLGAASKIWDQLGEQHSADMLEELNLLTTKLSNRVGDQEFKTEWQRGWQRALIDVVQTALCVSP